MRVKGNISRIDATVSVKGLVQNVALILLGFWLAGFKEAMPSPSIFTPNQPLKPSLTALEGENIPPEFEAIRSAFHSKISMSLAAAAGGIDAAYFHMLQVRAGANFHPHGTTGVYHSQWQTIYWKARAKFVRGEVKTVCEAGLGSGHSGIVLLTATTNSSWYDDGAMFHSFDNGLSNEPEKKVAAYNYMKLMFGGRVKFHFGPESSVEVTKVKSENPGFLCDIIHIDAAHDTAGVMKDIDAMHSVSHSSTVLLMDDYTMESVNEAVRNKKDKIEIDTIYSEDGKVDWLIQSAERKIPEASRKLYVVGHFVH